MKYIESKMDQYGIYHHSDVIEAQKKGADVEYWDINSGCWRLLGFPILFETVEYRAQVPDTYGIHESSSTLREVKGNAGPAVAEILLDRIKELEHVLTDIIRDHDDPLEPGTTQYFWNQARAALNKEQK